VKKTPAIAVPQIPVAGPEGGWRRWLYSCATHTTLGSVGSVAAPE
jgi:hypothetical protein